jgi:MEMO1 family protein
MMIMPNQSPLLAGYIMPHPPVIVPGVETGVMKADQTVRAMKQLADDLAVRQPETVVLISPHAPLFSDYLFTYDEPELTGDLSAFGAPEIYLSIKQDQPLLDQFLKNVQEKGISAGSLKASQLRRFNLDTRLDHGAMVPLYFLNHAASFKLVVMASAGLPLEQLYTIGEQIHRAANMLGRKIVIVASGDQSHKVNRASPYGAVPEGAQYDNQLVAALKRGDRASVLNIDPKIRQRASECGYRAIVMLLGAFSHRAISSMVLSYEAPYGIGYCVARIVEHPDQTSEEPDPMETTIRNRWEAVKEHKNLASAPVRIARQTLERKIRKGTEPAAGDFQDLIDREPWLRDRAGIFVSLKKQGELRGCIGTTAPTTPSIVDEIIQNAISAATRDPRFNPVTADELPDLTISVDVLGQPERVESKNDLDPSRYGVIVRKGMRSGLLLPDLDGVDTVDEQWAIVCRKAGISPDSVESIERFRVTRYT